MWPPASIRSSEYIRTRESVSLERVPPTGGCFVPSQTYKDLVECADGAAALREIGSDLQWISNHCRIVTKRGGYADDCAEECLIYHFVVVNDPRDNVNPEDSRLGRNYLAAHSRILTLGLTCAV